MITEKVKKGKTISKATLVARRFEEEGKDMETDAPMCVPKTLKLCTAMIMQERWLVKSLEIKATYLREREKKTSKGSKK